MDSAASRPELEKFKEMVGAVVDTCDSRERALASRRLYYFMCEHYEKYIASLLQRVSDLDKNSDMVLADLMIIKQMLRPKLSMRFMACQACAWKPRPMAVIRKEGEVFLCPDCGKPLRTEVMVGAS